MQKLIKKMTYATNFMKYLFMLDESHTPVPPYICMSESTKRRGSKASIPLHS